jgi:hypothetical protein
MEEKIKQKMKEEKKVIEKELVKLIERTLNLEDELNKIVLLA